jgi:hypothetical protein
MVEKLWRVSVVKFIALICFERFNSLVKVMEKARELYPLITGQIIEQVFKNCPLSVASKSIMAHISARLTKCAVCKYYQKKNAFF